jgi:hypothetical protein
VGLSKVSTALERWKAELLDLSRNNQLLYFKKNRALSLTHPHQHALFEGLVDRVRTYRLYRPDDDEEAEAEAQQLALVLNENGQNGTQPAPSSVGTRRPPRPDEIVAGGEAKKVQAALYRYRLRSRMMLLEQGVNVLYVAFGTLDWRESETSEDRILSPLVLVPVRLERDTALDPYKLAPLDEAPIFNPALAFKMERDFKLRLGMPETEEADQPSLDMILDRIRESLAGRKDWVVRPEAHLGLFSFAKQAMYQDLAANQQLFYAHPAIRAIAGEEDGLLEPILDLLSADQLDAQIAPADVFQVLDADASQQEAIAAVKAGASLVIQGPPGTGKSQTITNIIAECLAQEKTVLFVSEKMAALSVVEERLSRAGLHEFCLKAHSQDVDKAAVVRELAAALRGEHSLSRNGAAEQDLARLGVLRTQLTAYAKALHDNDNPLHRSAYQIHGELARRTNVPILTFELPDLSTLTPQRMAELLDIVQRLEQVSDVLLQAHEHPWSGCTLGQLTPQLRIELDQRLLELLTASDELRALQEQVRSTWGLGPHSSLDAARWVRDLLPLLDGRASVPAEWFRSESLGPLLDTASEYRLRTEEYTGRRSALLERYVPALLECDLDSILENLRAGGRPDCERINGDGDPAQRALTQRVALEAAVARTALALHTVVRAGYAVAGRLGLPAPTTVATAARLADIADIAVADPRPDRVWFELARLTDLEELASEAGQLQTTVDTTHDTLQQQFEDKLFDLTTAEFATRFEETYASWTRSLRPGYHRDLGRLKHLLKQKVSFGYEDALNTVRQARRLATAQASLDAKREVILSSFSRHYAGAHTNWAGLQQALASVRKLLMLIDGPAPSALVDLMTGQSGGPVGLRPDATALGNAVTEVDAALSELQTLISLDDLPVGRVQPEDIQADALVAWLESWLAALLPLWSAADTLVALRKQTESAVARLSAEAEEARAVREMERALVAASNDLQRTFGQLFHGLSTNWDEILGALAWTGRLLDHFKGSVPRDTFIEVVCQDVQVDRKSQDRLTELVDSIGGILEALGA